MKISRAWLQTFFDAELPDAAALSDALTFHAFEIESAEKSGSDDILDVKITANRGHDCLSHRGIARELSAILNIPLKDDPLRAPISLDPKTPLVAIDIRVPGLCSRYAACYVTGVKVGPSPEWLRTQLESIGQRSINNVVDATNYVMFHLGQPLHAFDAGQLAKKEQDAGQYAIAVRNAHAGEKMVALDDKSYELDENMLVIADAHSDEAIGIAGVKGGRPAAITEATKDIIIESANFDGASVRKTAQALKLRTDASSRFEQVLSPELATYGMAAVVRLILELAGGSLAGYGDVYPKKQEIAPVSVSIEQVNQVLGTSFSGADIEDVFARLGLPFAKSGESYAVTPPFERLDLVIPEDLVEEVGRIRGYDAVPEKALSPLSAAPAVNPRFAGEEATRERLMQEGFSEVITSVFTEHGERQVLNKVGGERPFLRATIVDGIRDALARNVRLKDLLGLAEVRLFEIGTVWREGKEILVVASAAEGGEPAESALENADVPHYDELPASGARQYQPFSKYPFIVRDIAMWTPKDTKPEDIESRIRGIAGELAVRISCFDRFEKNDRVSFAFRIVFQSFEKTLTDAEVNAIMERVHADAASAGFEVR